MTGRIDTQRTECAQNVCVGDHIYFNGGLHEVVFVNVRRNARRKHVRIELAHGTMLNYELDERVRTVRP